MPDDSFQLAPLADLGEADQLDAMLGAVQQADDEGVFAPLTARADASESAATAQHPTRVRTIRLRLHLLGYLRKDNGSGIVDAALRRALRRFQDEAGLTIDGQAGPRTWTALEQLVGFESTADFTAWLPNSEAVAPEAVNRALWRAVRLRLHVQGFLASPRIRADDNLIAALAAFTGIAAQIKLTDTLLPAAFCLPTLRVLFDQDAILQHLAFIDPAAVPAAAVPHVGRFMLAHARIELWLHGYDVTPGGRVDSVTVDAQRNLRVALKAKERDLYDAMIDHWRNLGLSRQQATRAADIVDRVPEQFLKNLGELFKNLLFDEPEADAQPGSDLLYEQLAALRRPEQETVWTRIRNLGSSIWDGVRRALRWVRALVKKGLSTLRGWAKNLARLAFRYASEAFAPVLHAVRQVVEAWKVLGPRTLPRSSVHTLVLTRDGDFDMRLFISPDAQPGQARALTTNLLVHAMQFRQGVRMLQALVQAGLALLRRTVLSGWFSFVLLLVRLFRWLRSWRDALQAPAVPVFDG